MALWDMVTSSMMAITIIPMPKDVKYGFAGVSYGTFNSCEAQAFLLLLGSGYLVFSNMFLNIYYVCTIRYEITEETFRKIIEPIALLVFTCISMVLPIQFSQLKYLNPVPYEIWCCVGPYPYDCNGKDIPCLRGEPYSASLDRFFTYFILFWLGGLLLVTLFSMVMVILTFRNHDIASKLVLKQKQIQWAEGSNVLEFALVQRSRTKTITKQALLYILAAFATWSFLIVSFFYEPTWVAIAKQIFQPSQGFFNALIFIFHKIDDLKRCYAIDNLSSWDAFIIILRKPSEAKSPIYVSNTAMVETDRDNICQGNAEEDSHEITKDCDDVNNKATEQFDSQEMLSENATSGGLKRIGLHLRGDHVSETLEMESDISRTPYSGTSGCSISYPSEESSDPSGALSESSEVDADSDRILRQPSPFYKMMRAMVQNGNTDFKENTTTRSDIVTVDRHNDADTIEGYFNDFDLYTIVEENKSKMSASLE